MQKKIPLRRCVGCREMREKPSLVRVVRSPQGEVTVDIKGKAPGRGAYVCRDAKCLKKAVKSGALDRALEHKIPDELLARLTEEMEEGSNV